MRTQLASAVRRMCSRHRDRQATALRVTRTNKPLPQQIVRPECAECSRKPLTRREGTTEQIFKL